MTTSSDRVQEGTSILELGNLILHECLEMDRQCKKDEIPSPSMLPGTNTTFWSDTASIIAQSRTKAIGLLERLTTLLQGPHDFLHEFVASNWDHGALYTFLQSPILDYLVSTGGCASLFKLAEVSNIPEDKLTRILALLRCKNFLHEPQIGVFSLTAVSEELARDEDFRAWVEFQYVDRTYFLNRPYTDEKGCSKPGWQVLILRTHLLRRQMNTARESQHSNRGMSICPHTVYFGSHTHEYLDGDLRCTSGILLIRRKVNGFVEP
jgi:hypothetical protein